MAINKKLISFATQAQFDNQLLAGNIDNRSIVFIEDKKRIWTHGVYFDTLWDYIQNKPSTLDEYGITDAAKKINSLYYVEGNTTGTAGAWTGSIPEVTSLYTGLTIAYKIGVSGASTTNLNINSLGDKLVRRNTGNLTTHLPAGSVVILTYDGTYWVWADYTDGNTYDRTYWNNTITAGAPIYSYKLLMQGLDGKFYPLTLETGTGTTKTVSTQEFEINSQILYYATTATVATNGTATNVYSEIPITTLSYTANQASWTSQQLIYLKGTILPNGNFKLDNTSYTSFMTQTLPTTADGFVYVLLGYMYSTTAMRLFQFHPMYEYRDGALRTYMPMHSHGNITDGGAIGSVANKPIITGTGGVLQVGSFGTSANTFAEGNHTHSQYLESITKAQVEAVLTGNITSHTHSYLPLSGGTLTGNLKSGENTMMSIGNNVDLALVKKSGAGGFIGVGLNRSFIVARSDNAAISVGDTFTPLLTIDGNNSTFNGSVTAPTFIGALSGNASSATYASTVTLTADNTTNATRYPLFVSAVTGNLSPRTDTGFTYNPSTGALTATTFIGALSGNASSATALTSNAGSNTNPIYFSSGKPVASTYSFGNASGNIPISNGTLNINLNADLLDGNHGSYYTGYTDTAINSIEIGGRNLLLDTKSERSGIYPILPSYILTEKPIVGETYTLSGWFKFAEGQLKRIMAYNSGGTVSLFSWENSAWSYGEWFYFNKTFTWRNEVGSNSANDTHINIYGGGSDGLLSYAKLIKLEKGNKATDWSPAPEDQVSDWNTTDVNSFSYIKNKPSTFTPSTHTHNASDINAGVLGIARIPTGTTSSTVALGNHTHSYLPLAGGTMSNTNLVTNLNADLLDGIDSSRFVYGTDTINAVTSLNDLTTAYKAGFYATAGSSTGYPHQGDCSTMLIPYKAATSSYRFGVRIGGWNDIYHQLSNGDGIGTWYKIWSEKNFTPSDYVTLNTGQVITGIKSFVGGINYFSKKVSKIYPTEQPIYINGTGGGSLGESAAIGFNNPILSNANIVYHEDTFKFMGSTMAHYIGIMAGSATFSGTVTAPNFTGTASVALALKNTSDVIVGAPATGQIRYDYHIPSSTLGLFPVSNNTNSVLSLNRHSGSYDSQLGFSSNGNLYYRSFTAEAINTTKPWRQIWDSTAHPTTLAGYGVSSSDTLFNSKYLLQTGGNLTGNLVVKGSISTGYDVTLGAPVHFQKTNYGTQVDTITSTVKFTSGDYGGIYNSYSETYATHGTSPLGTEWNCDGFGDLTNIKSRNYQSMYDAISLAFGGYNQIVGQELIMHIVGTDLYYKFVFSQWTSGQNGGGFTYIRTQLIVNESGLTVQGVPVVVTTDYRLTNARQPLYHTHSYLPLSGGTVTGSIKAREFSAFHTTTKKGVSVGVSGTSGDVYVYSSTNDARGRMYANDGGSGFWFEDPTGADAFKLATGDSFTYLHMPQSYGRITLGRYGDYKPEHQLVTSGSALFEGFAQSPKFDLGNGWDMRAVGDDCYFQNTNSAGKLQVNGSAYISGNVTASGGNSTNWNTAYGWGNHSGLYSARANGLGSSNNSVLVSDTRSVNPLPNTDLQRGIWFDFKTSSAIGLTGAGTYSGVITLVPYQDNSGNGNTAFRLAQSYDNLYFQNWTTVWGTWNKIYHTGNLNPVTLNTAQTITANKGFTGGINYFAKQVTKINPTEQPICVNGTGGGSLGDSAAIGLHNPGIDYANLVYHQETFKFMNYDMTNYASLMAGTAIVKNSLRVGTVANPIYQLEVAGSARMSELCTNSIFGNGSSTLMIDSGYSDIALVGSEIYLSAWDQIYVTAGGAVNLTSGTRLGLGLTPTYDLQLASNSAAKPSSNTWTISSDIRLKEDIVLADLDRCYEIVKTVPLKRYTWKDSAYSHESVSDRSKLGWIANDVQTTFPKAVKTHKQELTTYTIEMEEYEEQEVLEELEITEKTEIQFIDGIAKEIIVPVEKLVKKPQYIEYDLLDSNGEPTGRKYQAPKMITKVREKKVYDVIEDCLDLDADQIYAAMYGAIQKLQEKVETLEAELEILKTPNI